MRVDNRLIFKAKYQPASDFSLVKTDLSRASLADFAGSRLVLNIFPSINNLLSVTLLKTLTAFAGLWQNILWPALNKVWSLIQNNLLPVFTAIGEKAGGDIIPPLKTLGEEILPMLSDGLETVTEWIKKATDFFNGLADAVSSFSLPDVLTPGSPPPMAYALMDIAKASGIAKGSIDALTQGVSNSSKTFSK